MVYLEPSSEPEKVSTLGFKVIRLHIDLDTDATDEQLATLLKLTERYCVVYQTLRQAPALAASMAARGR